MVIRSLLVLRRSVRSSHKGTNFDKYHPSFRCGCRSWQQSWRVFASRNFHIHASRLYSLSSHPQAASVHSFANPDRLWLVNSNHRLYCLSHTRRHRTAIVIRQRNLLVTRRKLFVFADALSSISRLARRGARTLRLLLDADFVFNVNFRV